MAGGGVGVSTRVASTTIEEWSKMVSEETEKKLILLAMMKSKGRIKTGCSGHQHRWVVRKSDHTLQPFVDSAPVSFSPTDTKTSATISWRGYYAQDTITLQEKLEQGGPEAMIKVFANREETIRRGVMRSLAAELLKHGQTVANIALNTFEGIETLFGIAAQTASDIIATTHNGTYGGLSTAVGTVSSTNTRLWTPVFVNTNHTPSGGSQQTWANYADEYIRDGILRIQATGEDPDLIYLNQLAYKQLLNLMDDKERIPVVRGSNTALVSLGFNNHIELDGVPVVWDSAVPSTDAVPYGEDGVTLQGYMFTTSKMWLKVLGEANSKSLFTARTTFNPSYRSDDIFLHLIGNMKYESPRYFGKFAEISGVAS